MKIKLLIAMTCCVSLFGSTSAKGLKFAIKGQIEGLQKGDTLRFESINLPSWDPKLAFEVVLDRDNVFSYSGTHAHTQLYSMQCFPSGEKLPKSDRLGVSLLISQGETRVEGTRENIYHSNVLSAMYDDKIKEIKRLEDSLGDARSAILVEMTAKFEQKDTLAGRALNEKFNGFNQNNKADFARLRGMKNRYFGTVSNEYVAAEWCQKSFEPLDTLRKHYDRFDAKTKASYYGELLGSIIERLTALEPGQPAPEVTFVNTKGESVALRDFRGKYLLIYHYGLCPGSMQVDGRVSKLYAENGDKLEVVALTNSTEQIAKLARETKEGSTVMGMDFKKILTGMTSHPWPHEVTDAESYKLLNDSFNIQGLPFFIFLSPDGTIIARGFSEAFDKACAELKK